MKSMGREENIRVFQDTERLCKANPILRESVAVSINRQKMIPEWECLPHVEKGYTGSRQQL